jgi:hypothetical protein
MVAPTLTTIERSSAYAMLVVVNNSATQRSLRIKRE